ncbi:MAG TPA: hypothetical protein VGS22_23190 [Thermoanaerobaculia bacterium]|jgi:hypothetical protein|nr:hypothetical protein [Thermoanaerobaculia bacterium]
MKTISSALALGSMLALSAIAQTPAPPKTAAPPAPPAAFVVHQAVLFQPDALLRERLGGDGLIATFYLKQIETEAKKILAAAPRGEGCSGVLISTVRPGSAAKIWFAFPAAKRLPLGLRLDLEKKLALVPAPIPTGGPVAMGLAFSVWGGDKESQEMMRQGPPVPDAWRLVAARSKKAGLPFDEMLALAWPP